jgi:hypothetical protein
VAVFLSVPLILTLATQRLLSTETIAALVGGLVGIALSKDKE